MISFKERVIISKLKAEDKSPFPFIQVLIYLRLSPLEKILGCSDFKFSELTIKCKTLTKSLPTTPKIVKIEPNNILTIINIPNVIHKK